jgi:hypothetical protein
MTYDRIVRLYEWKPLPTILAGRPTIRWENDLKEDLRIQIIGQNTTRIKLNGRKSLRRRKLLRNEVAPPNKEGGQCTHTMKNLNANMLEVLVNGEVILSYAGGTTVSWTTVQSL